ncbi:hypothetical protein BOX15_Mlig015055g1 [Macrostomum lignano]|uniref:Uncharacterized protein n=2 Tax=Macrostomum lignano TaxID=282301 RepID=A0A267E7G3_9PLAT|nr:hypothetical protein BOX15_Mlig015055g3 [Macrostomum lignano]PAA57535.1 hypothetical protein BOX15_Mlig015055g1 [Macrostomum lignano]
MDPLFQALSLFRRRKYEKCIEKCTEILDKNSYDEAAWLLKMQALTEQVYVDDIENDEDGMAEGLLDDSAIASVARPGTSLRVATAGGGSGGLQQAMRPSTQSGRPVTGFVRPGTQGSGAGSLEQALKTPRTASNARPVTSSSGRLVRLGTASMLSSPDGPFINLSRLNFSKYAPKPQMSRALFEYILYHENDVRTALQLAAMATEAHQFQDWWWKLQLARCYYKLGLFRDCEQQLRSAMKQQECLESYLLLGKVYTKLDQPLAAIDNYNQGLTKFPNDRCLLTGLARIQEGLGNLEKAAECYKDVLRYDAMNVEALASIATQYFYNDQPELALKLYRRLLQLGLASAELYTNLALCCFYAQQYDMCLTCFDRAITVAKKEELADVWYNLGHVALAVGDLSLSYQAFRLALSYNNDHAEAYNNLGVLELRRNNLEMARSFFQAASTLSPSMFEPHYNVAIMAERMGDLQSAYQSVNRAQQFFPNHSDSKDMLNALKVHFSEI